MGCISSKVFNKKLKQKVLLVNAGFPNHVVSLTSTTYGALKLDQDVDVDVDETRHMEFESKMKRVVAGTKVEEINTWELMSDLEDEKSGPNVVLGKKEGRSPFRRLSLGTAFSSPKGAPKCPKGNSPKGGVGVGGAFGSPKGPTKGGVGGAAFNSPKGGVGVGGAFDSPKGPTKGGVGGTAFNSPKGGSKVEGKENKGSGRRAMRSGSGSGSGSGLRSGSGLGLGLGSGSVSGSRRKSLGPLFDPELIDSFEKELSLEKYDEEKCEEEEVCPTGGENSVVVYTTTLRGIRKTYEECNTVRSVLESYHIQVIERDISMDSGFKQELKTLLTRMGRKEEMRVPAVFVKGRFVGGADEVVSLDEDGKLEPLLGGICKAVAKCEGCGGVRFVMCRECNGSRKLVDQRHNCVVRCGECNENGLIHCPLCSSIQPQPQPLIALQQM